MLALQMIKNNMAKILKNSKKILDSSDRDYFRNNGWK
jgi:hypothetical protein